MSLLIVQAIALNRPFKSSHIRVAARMKSIMYPGKPYDPTALVYSSLSRLYSLPCPAFTSSKAVTKIPYVLYSPKITARLFLTRGVAPYSLVWVLTIMYPIKITGTSGQNSSLRTISHPQAIFQCISHTILLGDRLVNQCLYGFEFFAIV